MNPSGNVNVSAPREDVWRALSDPRELARSLPGVDDVVIDDDGVLCATVRPDVGLGPAPFTVRVWVRDLNVSQGRILAHGHGDGAEFVVDVTAELRLTGNGDETTVGWRADVRFSGVLASVGQRVLGPLVAAELDRTAHRLAEALTSGPRPPVGSSGGSGSR